MNDFHMEIPLEQRDRLRVLERQRELAMKKRLGEEMDRERAAFILERDRAVGLSERLLARDRLGDRMMGMGRFLDRGREREARLVAGERPVGVDRRLESVGGGSRLDGGVGLSRFETAALVDRRLDGGGDRRLEAVAGRDDDREGVRPGPRPSTLDRLRQTDRERDEEREKARDRVREEDGITERSATTEKQKERDDSAGALQDLVAQYKNALVELTFNSKPIITNLTINAGENAQAAKGIAATICARILEVPNEQKLPTLYLLDSIVKNIGGDYVKYFAARLPEVFCKAYKQVDPSTHPSMQHLFRTWRGVFPGAPLRLIETELQFPPIANGASLTSNSAKAAESPSQRSGHSIHVNPKYLEAQRQRLQQSSRVEAEPTENNGETSIREIERAESVVLDSPKGWPDTPERSTLLPRAQRGDAFGGESGYARKPLSSFLDYDYGSADPRTEIVGERVAARDEAWERGWLSGSEDAVRSSESGAGLRYSQRNGYELRQSSPRALVDAYGNIRGPRAPRMPPPPVQPAQGLDARTKGPLRNWRNSEEEEYVWEDMSPRLLDHARLRETMKNDNWYSGHGDNSLMPGGSSREKPVSLDQPLPDHLSWRRAGALNDRPMSAESRLAIQREPDERIPLSNLQQDIGPRVVPELATDIPTLGSNSRSGLALRPPSRLRHSLPQQLSPPAQSRLRPFVSGRNPSPSSMGSLYLPSQSAKLSLLSSSNGMPEAMGPNMAVRAMMRPGLGSSFGSGMLNLGSLSPVTPVSSITFQQRQQSQRPPSPPPMAPPSQPQLLIIPPIAPVPHLANFQSLQQQNSNLLRPMQHQALSSGLHGSQSSQQGLPFLSLPQQPPVQQLLQRPPAVQPLPQPRQPLQQTLHTESMPLSQPTSEQKVPSLQPSRSLPMPPQLLQSLQQLQHHLPPISGTSLQQSQASQPQHLQSAPPPVQQGQPPQLLQQTQHPPQQLLPPPSQPLQQPQALAQQPPQLPQVSGYVPQPVGSVVNDNSSSSSGLQSQSDTNLLAAFLQSGLMPPPQSSQILTHRPSSPKASSGSTESTSSQPSTHLQPPLPSGPPPIQASNSGAGPLPGQGVLSLPSGVPIMTSVPVPPLANLPAFTSQPLRMAQPPLPPGPPPVSSQVGTSLSQPPVSGDCLPPSANNLSSLLSSLMAQGLISATSSAPPILPESSGGMAASSTSSVSAFPSSTIGLAFSGAPLVPPLGTLVSGAPALSTTLVTASRTQESMATPIVTSSTERITAMDPIAMEFKQEVLRERHESVINALYFDFPRQCKTCGLRFKLQEDHSKHMDWHVSRNRRQKSSKKISRKWFVSVKEWLSGTGASASEVAPSFFAEDVTVKPEEHEVVAVPADENQSACALCGEPFEDFYSDETEEWMYKGAVYMNVPPGGVTEALDSSHLGPIVHAKCRSESGATVTATDSAEDDEGEEDDELGRRRKRVRY